MSREIKKKNDTRGKTVVNLHFKGSDSELIKKAVNEKISELINTEEKDSGV